MKLAWIYLSDEINLIWVEKKLQPDVKNGSKSRIHFVTQCSEFGKIVQLTNVFTNCESVDLFYSEKTEGVDSIITIGAKWAGKVGVQKENSRLI